VLAAATSLGILTRAGQRAPEMAEPATARRRSLLLKRVKSRPFYCAVFVVDGMSITSLNYVHGLSLCWARSTWSTRSSLSRRMKANGGPGPSGESSFGSADGSSLCSCRRTAARVRSMPVNEGGL